MNRSIKSMVIGCGAMLIVAGVTMRTGAGAEDAVTKDMKMMQGAWAMQSFENSGKALEDDKVKTIKLVIEGVRYKVDLGGMKLELTFKLDPSKKPKAIDLVMTKGDEKAITQGIYEINETTLRLCRPTEAGNPRPTEFATKE